MPLGQILKDLELREINLLFEQAIKKQACLEKCMKPKPVDYAVCQHLWQIVQQWKGLNNWLTEGFEISVDFSDLCNSCIPQQNYCGATHMGTKKTQKDMFCEVELIDERLCLFLIMCVASC